MSERLTNVAGHTNQVSGGAGLWLDANVLDRKKRYLGLDEIDVRVHRGDGKHRVATTISYGGDENIPPAMQVAKVEIVADTSFFRHCADAGASRDHLEWCVRSGLNRVARRRLLTLFDAPVITGYGASFLSSFFADFINPDHSFASTELPVVGTYGDNMAIGYLTALFLKRMWFASVRDQTDGSMFGTGWVLPLGPNVENLVRYVADRRPVVVFR